MLPPNAEVLPSAAIATAVRPPACGSSPGGSARLQSPAALAEIAKVGFDPVFGARPLKRAIQAQIENPLASRILSGEFGSGDLVRVDAEGGKLVFRK